MGIVSFPRGHVKAFLRVLDRIAYVGYAYVGMAKEKEKPVSIGAQLVALRYAKMSPEERSAAARNAAKARWGAKVRGAKAKKNGL